MRALIEACDAPDFPATVVTVLSNRPDAAGLDFAKLKNIPIHIVDHNDYQDRMDFDQALQDILVQYDIDLICLAGFMRLLGAEFVTHWQGKMINIHPSLLPSYKGLHTHERVLADRAKKTGCTVHFVTPDMDEGPIILQQAVTVKSDDTPETLAARVLEQEQCIYPEAVRLIAEGKIRDGL